jgi:hypothetical protein
MISGKSRVAFGVGETIVTSSGFRTTGRKVALVGSGVTVAGVVGVAFGKKTVGRDIGLMDFWHARVISNTNKIGINKINRVRGMRASWCILP